jgi:hypothetical protein
VNRTLYILSAALVVAVSATPVVAQETRQTGPGRGGSPHVHSEWRVDGARIVISYGRPYLKGRPEAQMMPPGQPWRTGADTATIIRTDKPLTFGTVKLEPGSYTINTEPGPSAWQLILGRLTSPGQWGIPYKPALEVGRSPMTVGKAASPQEQLTLLVDDTPAGATLRVEWGTTSATIPFTVGSGA